MSETFGGKPSVFARFFGDVFSMPVWQKAFLSIAALVGGAGVAGQTYNKLAPQPPGQPAPAEVDPHTSVVTSNPLESPQIISQPPGSLPGPETSTPDGSAPPSTMISTHSPWMTRIGLSFVGGFILGWAFRVFIKTMAIVTFLGVALLMGLSYFHVVNVDFSAARVKYADSIAWISDQAAKLRDVAVTYLPSTGTSMAGLAVGFKKK